MWKDNYYLEKKKKDQFIPCLYVTNDIRNNVTELLLSSNVDMDTIKF